MSKGHNKRRNASFVADCLTRRISRALVEGDQRIASTALRIMKRAFRPGTELHRELKLARALLRSTVRNDTLAASIVDEARAAARTFDVEKLDREKSLLIRNVNHKLGDGSLFEQTVPDYRMHATVQTLLNEWRAPMGRRDLERLAEYEGRLVDWLLSEKSLEDDGGTLEEHSRTDMRLLQRAMMKRIDEKYAGQLTGEQREIIRLHALAEVKGSTGALERKLDAVRRDAVARIDARLAEAPDDAYANERLTEVKQRIIAENVSAPDDALVSRFMLYAKLAEEIESGEGEEG